MKVSVLLYTVVASLLISACSLDASLLKVSLPSAAPIENGLSLKFSTGVVEFGEVMVGTVNSRTVTVINQGASEARNLKTWRLNFPFKYLDGVFPGTGGSCGGTLLPGASCTLVLEFSASAPASFQDHFEIKYDYGEEALSNSVPLIASADSAVHAVDVKAGVMMFCARLSNNSLKCWGEGGYGHSLGNGIGYAMYDGEPTPLTPLQMSSGVLDFDMTWAYSCALKIGGEIWCWGAFTPGGTWGLNPPHQVIASGAVQVSISSATAGCAIMDTGLIKCWGDNNNSGVLGNGVSSGYAHPVGDVLGLSGVFTDVAVGDHSACALKDNGEVWCWGSNSSGGLAKSSGTIYTSAVQAENMPGGIVELESSASYLNSYCVIVETGDPVQPRKVYCWGESYGGATPLEITGLSGDIKNIQSTMNSSQWCVTAGDETHLECWYSGTRIVESNNYGLDHILNVEMAGYESTFCGISHQHVYCWGEHKYGMLGIGGAKSEIPSASPVEIPGLSGIDMMAMSENGYAIDTEGALYAWGKNYSGACGSGGTEPIPMAKEIFSSGVSSVAAVSGSSCISRDGEFYCAGSGYGNTFAKVGSSAITQASMLDAYAHYCGLANGAAYCWGWNSSNVLGVSSCDGSCLTTPQAVSGMETGVTDISVGYEHSCAIKSGQVYCWGDADSGQLGSIGGATVTPRLIGRADSDFVEVDSGYERGCATKASGGIICWGGGMGGTSPTLLPGTGGVVATNLRLEEYGGLSYIADGKMYYHNGTSASEMATNWSDYYKFSLSGGTYYAECGILAGKVRCSGSNVSGNLGLSDPSPATVKTTPFPVFNLYD